MVMKIYVLGGHTLAVKTVYDKSKARMSMGNKESGMFRVNVGLKRWCVIPPVGVKPVHGCSNEIQGLWVGEVK